MADFSDNDSFVFIDANSERSGSLHLQPNKLSSDHHATNISNQQQQSQSLFVSNAQLTHSIVSNTGSIDGWSEISAPSLRSNKSNRAPITKDYHLIHPHPKTHIISGTNSTENAIFSSKSDSINNENENNNNHNHNPNDNNHNIGNASFGSVGSRVPFSWAEITKIQPTFHTDNESGVHRPKVFDQTPKIRTRVNRHKYIKKNNDNNSQQQKNDDDNKHQNENDEHLPVIPEADPCATKSDLGRKVRKSGKRGSRLKFPNGRKGSRRNSRKKSQK